MFSFIIVLYVIVCILLMLVILIQSGRSSGLVESFSFAESILGTKTPKFMTRLTAILASAFILFCVLLSLLTYQRSRSIVEKEVSKTPKQKITTQKQETQMPPAEETKTEEPLPPPTPSPASSPSAE